MLTTSQALVSEKAAIRYQPPFQWKARDWKQSVRDGAVSKGYHDGGVGTGTASVTRESHVLENGQRRVKPHGGQVGATGNP